MVLQTLSTSIFLSSCSVLGKLDPLHMTVGASLLVLFLRSGMIGPVSRCVDGLLVPGLSTTNDERPPLLIRFNSCSLVPGKLFCCGASGEFVDDGDNGESTFDAPPPL